METTNILVGLRDIEGIIGSFVVSSDGDLVGRDLPSVYDDETLAGVAPRLLRLRDGVAGESREPAALVLRYLEHKIHVRSAGSGILCVLTEPKVNTPALRVGMKLVARRVTPLAERAVGVERSSPPAPPVTERSRAAVQPVVTPSQSAPAQPASSAHGGMIYRGQRVRG
jgi:predicted regulator of Ras-like GTPase activity (Roadblock/LC7/MglB family)